jgi:Bacterial protein of unknown function (DUF885)
MAKGSLGFFEGPVAVWAHETAGPDEKLLDEFQESNAHVIAAFRDFGTWLETELKPRSTGKNAIGEDLFLAKLKAEEMVEMTLDSLLARGEANLEKDYQTITSEVRPSIEETPSHARSGSFASMDTPRPYEATATQASLPLMRKVLLGE